MVLHAHHRMVWRRCASLITLVHILIVVIIVATALIRKVLRPFMLVGAAVVLEAADNLIDVGGRVLVQLLIMAEDDDSNVDGTEDGELMGLLEQAAFALEECDGSVAIVPDGLDLYAHQSVT